MLDRFNEAVEARKNRECSYLLLSEIQRMSVNMNLKEIAKLSNVSITTASRALNGTGYVSPEKKEKILKIAKQYHYIPNRTAVNLRNSSTKLIGYIVSDISNYFHGRVASGIEDSIRVAGYNLIVCSTQNDPEIEKNYLDALVGLNVAALIINTTGENDDLIVQISRHIPIVYIVRRVTGAYGDIIDLDNKGAIRELCNVLFLNGHRKIYFINGSKKYSNARERLAGFIAANHEMNVKINRNYIYEGDFSEKSGYEAVSNLINRSKGKMPTAILCGNDSISLGAMKALHERGYLIPRDVSFASFNDIPYEGILGIMPTVASFNSYSIGCLAGKCALERIANPLIAPRILISDAVIRIGNTITNINN